MGESRQMMGLSFTSLCRRKTATHQTGARQSLSRTERSLTTGDRGDPASLQERMKRKGKECKREHLEWHFWPYLTNCFFYCNLTRKFLAHSKMADSRKKYTIGKLARQSEVKGEEKKNSVSSLSFKKQNLSDNGGTMNTWLWSTATTENNISKNSKKQTTLIVMSAESLELLFHVP